MATETMSIKDFMDGNYGVKKKWSLFKKKAKKIRTCRSARFISNR
ncbi:hypothetical protein QBX67_25915 [Bacillus sp. LS15-K4]|nr:hypothetical protein [Bacillus sp. LS15-K4]MDJ1478484.1 hypothetical protein [Bacillus sp. LS15-K4]